MCIAALVIICTVGQYDPESYYADSPKLQSYQQGTTVTVTGMLYQ